MQQRLDSALAHQNKTSVQIHLPFATSHWLAQVRLDFSNLRQRLDWALAHDQEAHLMADAARRVAHRRLRYQDIQVLDWQNGTLG